MLSYFTRAEPGAPVQSSDRYHEGSWAYVASPTPAELDELVGMLGVQADLLQDALDPNEVPRLQHEHDVVYFFVRVPFGQGDQMRTVPLLLAIGPQFFLTLSSERLQFLDKFPAGDVPFTTAWRTQVFLKVCMHITAAYQHALNDIGKRVRGSLAAGTPIKNDDIVRLVAYEGILNDLLGAFGPMHTMLGTITSGKIVKLYDEDKDLYEDVVLGAGQVVEALKSQLKTTVNFREAYSLITTNDLNRFIKIFTILTVMLMIPNLLAGFWGMNVALPFQHNPYAFSIIVTVTLTAIGGLIYTIWHKRIL